MDETRAETVDGRSVTPDPGAILSPVHGVPAAPSEGAGAAEQLGFDLGPSFGSASARPVRASLPLAEELARFQEFGQRTRFSQIEFEKFGGGSGNVPVFVNEYWTARQRQASSLHEISYRACFKPQLPRFFIERLSEPGQSVYDPFMGRGTTPIEAALLGRVPMGNDINPLSVAMARPRLQPPALNDVRQRLNEIPLDGPGETPEDLLAFFHPATLKAIGALRGYLLERRADGRLDALDEWIAMVALNRLTGHSNGFFSVYTLPPNQATSAKRQRILNERRNQTPPPRDVREIILKKSRQLLGDVDAEARRNLAQAVEHARFTTKPADAASGIPDGSVRLVVTSPPFLNVVQYAADNWLRCWFLGIDAGSVKLTLPSRVDKWQDAMTRVFGDLHRVLEPGGHVAFEVGEVQRGRVRLEEAVLPCGVAAGLEPVLVMINDQEFTKTANCWGIDNMAVGTNTNRIVVFRKRG